MLWWGTGDDDGSDMEDDEFTISAILDRKFSNGQYEYQVKWANFKRPTYVPDGDISATRLLRDYDLLHPRGCDPSDSKADRVRHEREREQEAADHRLQQQVADKEAADAARRQRRERLAARRAEVDYISKQNSIYDHLQYTDPDLYELKMADLNTIAYFQQQLGPGATQPDRTPPSATRHPVDNDIRTPHTATRSASSRKKRRPTTSATSGGVRETRPPRL